MSDVDLAPGQSCEVVVNVTANQAGQFTNTISVDLGQTGALRNDQHVPALRDATAVLAVGAPAAIPSLGVRSLLVLTLLLGGIGVLVQRRRAA